VLSLQASTRLPCLLPQYCGSTEGPLLLLLLPPLAVLLLLQLLPVCVPCFQLPWLSHAATSSQTPGGTKGATT
jgi:hypothetical protein